MRTSFYSCVEDMRLYSNEYKMLKGQKYAALDEGNLDKANKYSGLQSIIYDEMMKLYSSACLMMHERFMAGKISYEQRKTMRASLNAFFLD